MALVQEVHHRVHHIGLQHVIRGRSALGEMLRRIVAPNAGRSPRPVPSAVSAGSYPISVEHPRRSTLIGYEPKLTDSGLLTLLVNAINI